MKRILMDELKSWKDKRDRKPLIIRGARQVGKTWLLKEFGSECFEDVCYINFEERHNLKNLFDGDLSPQRIIEQLSAYHGKMIRPQKTLLIFDEIQEMPRALTSLKYFEEEAPEYAVCCAGSLLGVALHEGTSFPVGKVDFMDLRPLSFQEFLMANGEQMLIDYILKGNFDALAFSEKMQDYLKTYFIVGGMPAAVLKWIDSHDYFAVEKVQKQLIGTFENDFSKHAPKRMVEKIRYVWDSLHSQLAKENKKFIYGLVREGARAREYEDTLMWLTDAGIIRRTYCIKKPDLPLKAYADLQSFKVFFLDVGLLRVASGLSPRIILEGSRIFEEFKGAITEQYVCQELSVLDNLQSSYYWTSDAKAEVDFIFSDGLHVYPLEVKSGYSINAKSLKSYIDRYHPTRAIRTSLLPYRVDGNIINIPLYMFFALNRIMTYPNNGKC
jgi:predicted AAA+ superfamily ATPase